MKCNYFSIFVIFCLAVLQCKLYKSNIPNCLIDFVYENNIKCLKCMPNYFPNSDKSDCIRCNNNIEECYSLSKYISLDQTKIKCEIGYYFDIEIQNCSMCPFNCLFCALIKNKLICLACNNDFILKSNKCECPNGTSINLDLDKCISCKILHGELCIECNLDICLRYKSNSNYYDNNILSTYNNTNSIDFDIKNLIDINSNKCYKYDLNKRCIRTCQQEYQVNNVISCSNNAYYSNPEKYDFPEFLINEDANSLNNCNKYYKNCDTCSSIDGCITCNKGYALDTLNNICVDNDLNCNLKNNNLLDNSCINCINYKTKHPLNKNKISKINNSRCLKCLDNYILTNNQCYYNSKYKCNIKNCKNCVDNSCLDCNDGFLTTAFRSSCTLCSTLYNGCKRCDRYGCIECNENFTTNYLIDSIYVECTACYDNNCLKCNRISPKICNKCKENYKLVNNQCIRNNFDNCNLTDCNISCVGLYSYLNNNNNFKFKCIKCKDFLLSTKSELNKIILPKTINKIYLNNFKDSNDTKFYPCYECPINYFFNNKTNICQLCSSKFIDCELCNYEKCYVCKNNCLYNTDSNSCICNNLKSTQIARNIKERQNDEEEGSGYNIFYIIMGMLIGGAVLLSVLSAICSCLKKRMQERQSIEIIRRNEQANQITKKENKKLNPDEIIHKKMCFICKQREPTEFELKSVRNSLSSQFKKDNNNLESNKLNNSYTNNSKVFNKDDPNTVRTSLFNNSRNTSRFHSKNRIINIDNYNINSFNLKEDVLRNINHTIENTNNAINNINTQPHSSKSLIDIRLSNSNSLKGNNNNNRLIKNNNYLEGKSVKNSLFNSNNKFTIDNNYLNNNTNDKIFKLHMTTCGSYICDKDKCANYFEEKIIIGQYFRCKECKRVIVGYKDKIIEDIEFSCNSIASNNLDGEKNKNTSIIIYNNDYNIDIKKHYSENEKCCICQGSFPRFLIPCESQSEHHLHKNCLDNYIRRGETKCPICRKNLILPQVITSPKNNSSIVENNTII